MLEHQHKLNVHQVLPKDKNNLKYKSVRKSKRKVPSKDYRFLLQDSTKLVKAVEKPRWNHVVPDPIAILRGSQVKEEIENAKAKFNEERRNQLRAATPQRLEPITYDFLKKTIVEEKDKLLAGQFGTENNDEEVGGGVDESEDMYPGVGGSPLPIAPTSPEDQRHQLVTPQRLTKSASAPSIGYALKSSLHPAHSWLKPYHIGSDPDPREDFLSRQYVPKKKSYLAKRASTGDWMVVPPPLEDSSELFA